MATILAGLSALPVQIRFGCSVLWRWLFRRKQYPLLILGPARGGFLRTLGLLRRLELTKVIAVGKRFHFSLAEPGWPSKAYDHMMARGGLNVAAAGTPCKDQIDLAILAVTRRCAYRCRHCYEFPNLAAADTVAPVLWRELILELQRVGVSVVVLSGGEPMLRFDDVLELLRSGDKDLSDFHIHTSGYGVTAARVEALREAGLVAAGIGLDDFDRGRQAALRRAESYFDTATSALRLFSRAGLLTYVNICLTRPMMNLENLRRFYRFVSDQGAAALQLLEPVPCGACAGASGDAFCSEADRSVITEFYLETCRGSGRKGPAVYYDAFLEAPRHLGCMMGGLSHLQIDSVGNVKPCAFMPVSFGNAFREGFSAVYRKMRRAIPSPVRTGCPAMRMSRLIQATSAPAKYETVSNQWHAALSGALPIVGVPAAAKTSRFDHIPNEVMP